MGGRDSLAEEEGDPHPREDLKEAEAPGARKPVAVSPQALLGQHLLFIHSFLKVPQASGCGLRHCLPEPSPGTPSR